jgi:dienelactone hydrolase
MIELEEPEKDKKIFTAGFNAGGRANWDHIDMDPQIDAAYERYRFDNKPPPLLEERENNGV